MILPPLQYLRPASPAEAVTMLSDVAGSVVLAGGQTLLNMLKLDLAQPSALVDVHRIDGLRGVRTADDGTLVIGAATTYASLAAVHGHPVADMAAGLVDRQVRNRGTIGGNCCLNDPTNNFPPLLSALGARFRILGVAGERVLPADEFFLGTLATAVRPGELLTAIEIPPLPDNAVVTHEHLQVGADSWALARAVVRLDVVDGVVIDARVFLGAVYGSPLRLPEVERHLVGAAVAPSLADVAGVLRDVDAADDVHCSAAYRREMAEVQLRRALLAAVQRSTR
ncbi:carbon-monoxide dehydrogenase medium subunit [Amycolatopsis tolypomycina]|uniref:Carbon-monoxide dehydrogenase medium subunit n=1 Tax=Amycolatopsis tolypomycina TaxID=208445 RepID=A0A1H4Y3S2_9PSEU|nr:xanthine dehydrogenase family protein subunit M [Amycolatopsis tolypomycina]SED11811.1 carbon-monoxide dehydrogenase medium subunit [Amycolatopsis tolypomycina]